VESSCELGNEPSGSIKSWEPTEWLHKLWPLERYSAPQSYIYINSVALSPEAKYTDLSSAAGHLCDLVVRVSCYIPSPGFDSWRYRIFLSVERGSLNLMRITVELLETNSSAFGQDIGN
jgi:hypothetical protein